MAHRLESGGDDAVAQLEAEFRERELTRRSTPVGETSFGAARRSRRRPDPASVGRQLDAEELRAWHEERDAAIASSARQKAAIKGLVSFDAEVYEERLGRDDDIEIGRCTFAQCPRRAKWMAPERAADTDWYLLAVCNEHVSPPI